MKLNFLSFLGFALLGVCAAGANPAIAAKPLRILYDLRPPLVDRQNGIIIGTVGARGRLALERAGISVVWVESPVPRQDAEVADAEDAVCALGRLRSPKRLGAGLFSQAIIKGPNYVAVLRGDRQMPTPNSLQNWTNQPNLRWGIQRGFYYGAAINARAGASHAEVIPFTRAGNNLQMLLLYRRVDFILVQEDEAKILVANPEVRHQLRLQILDDLAGGESRYFYCSRNTPVGIIKAINAALESLPQ